VRVEEELADCDLAQGRPLASPQLNIYDDLGRLSQVIDRQGKRAALGLARTGSTACHGSGDFMRAFSTANIIPHDLKEQTFEQTQPRRHAPEPLDHGDGRSHLAHQTPYHPRSPRQVTAKNQSPRGSEDSLTCIFLSCLAILSRLSCVWRICMNGYQLGGGLSLITVLGKTNAFAEFLQARMVRALETEDPAELHYLLAQLDDYHSYMWRYYNKLAKDRPERMDPGV